MPYLEYQFTTQRIIQLLRLGFVARPLPQGQAYTVGNEKFRVGQIELLPNGGLRTESTQYAIAWRDYLGLKFDAVDGKRILVTQGLRIGLLRLAAQPDGTSVPEDAGTVDVLVLRSLSVQEAGNRATFEIRTRIEASFPNNSARTVIESVVGDVFPYLSTDITLPDIFNGKVSNAGIATDLQGSRIAIRIEVGYGDSILFVNPWRDFHAGNIHDNLNLGGNANDWSVLIDKWIVEYLVTRQLDDGFTAHKDTFQLLGGASVNWSPENEVPRVLIDFKGDAECPGLGFSVTYDVNGLLYFRIPPNQAGTLESYCWLDWTGNELELAACELSIAVTGGLIGGLALGPFGAVFGFVGGFIVAVAVATNYAPEIAPAACQQPSDHEIICQIPASQSFVIAGASINLPVSTVYGTPAGLVLAGALNLPALNQPPALRATAQTWSYLPPVFSCGNLSPHTVADAAKKIAAGELLAVGGASLTNAGKGRLIVTSAECVSDDPQGMFKPQNISLIDYGSSWQLSVATYHNDEYDKHPYGCGLLIASNGGVQVVTLPPIPPLTAGITQGLRDQINRQVSECNALIDPFWRFFARFNPKWNIDPSPEGMPIDRLWQIEITGLKPEETVRLQVGEERQVGTAHANSAGGARIGALVRNGAAAPPLGLLRGDGQHVTTAAFSACSGEVGGAKGKILSRQVELVPQASIPLRGKGVQMDCGRLDNRFMLYVLQNNESIDTFDLTDPAQPRLVRHLSESGISGMCLITGGIVTWGKHGLSIRSIEIRPEARSLSFMGTPAKANGDAVTSAVSFGGNIYALRDDRIDVHCAQSLDLITSTKLEGGTAIAIAGTLLVVRQPGGLAFFSLVGNLQLQAAGTLDLAANGRLVTSKLLTPRTAVFISDGDDGGVVIDLRRPQAPHTVMHYQEAPWFLNATRIGKTIARFEEDCASISISTVGRTMTV